MEIPRNQSLFTLSATATADQHGNKTFSCPRGTRTTTIRTTTTRPQIWKLDLYSAHPQTQGLDSKLFHPFLPHKLLNAFLHIFNHFYLLKEFFGGNGGGRFSRSQHLFLRRPHSPLFLSVFLRSRSRSPGMLREKGRRTAENNLWCRKTQIILFATNE